MNEKPPMPPLVTRDSPSEFTGKTDAEQEQMLRDLIDRKRQEQGIVISGQDIPRKDAK
jgi:hypothetical protein